VYHACAYADVLVFYVCMQITYVRLCQYVHVCGHHVHALMYGSVFNTLTCTSKGVSAHKCVSDGVLCVLGCVHMYVYERI
jgi:hypothetical protein